MPPPLEEKRREHSVPLMVDEVPYPMFDDSVELRCEGPVKVNLKKSLS